MIFSKIKKHFLKKNIQQVSKTSKIVVANSEIKRIGVLTTNELNDLYDFSSIVKTKFSKYKNVNLYSFKNFNKKDVKTFNFFTHKDFDWRGEIKDPSLISFVNEQFDLLICYFDTNNIFLESIAQLSQANFKIGFSNVNQSVFDLEISENLKSFKNVENFNSELLKYLYILESKDL